MNAADENEQLTEVSDEIRLFGIWGPLSIHDSVVVDGESVVIETLFSG